MELQFLLSPLIFITTLILVSFLAAAVNKRSKHNLPPFPTPPGPIRIPIIGNLHHLLFSLPHRRLRDLARRHGPIMLLRLGQANLVVISSCEAAKDVMKAHDPKFASRPELLALKILTYNCTGVAFSPYGEYQKQLKKVCMVELLNAKRVKYFSYVRDQEVENLVRDITLSCAAGGRRPINLSAKFKELTNVLIVRTAIGSKCRQQKRLSEVSEEMMRQITGFNMVDMFPSLGFVDVVTGTSSKLRRVHHDFDEILGEIIKEHQEKKNKAASDGKEEEEEDLVHVLLRLKECGDLNIPLTISNVKAFILDIFVGGMESLSAALEWAMVELMRHPQVMKKAQDEVRRALRGSTKQEKAALERLEELSFLNQVIRETFRLHPAVALIPRFCRETCTVQGYTILSGTRVNINAWALGRDPQYWGDDAESFRPERFDESCVDFKGTDFEFLPFGAGRRICPGINYAWVNMQLVLARVLFHFDWELPNGMKPEDLDMAETFSLSVGRKEELNLVAIPYSPVSGCA